MKKYRHPKEIRAMFFTFSFAILISIFFATITLGCGLFILGIALTWVYFTFTGKNNLDRLQPVTPNTQPELWRLANQSMQKWHLNDVNIYLHPTPNINASASDFGKDFIIINQGLWDTVNNEHQRKFVIGHELGHIGFNHSWLSIIAYQADNAFSGTILSFLFQFLLLRLSRMKELSADRIGLLTCGSLEAALQAIAILEIGKANPTIWEIEKVVEHLKSRKANISENFAEAFSTHPDTFERVEELINFAEKLGLSD